MAGMEAACQRLESMLFARHLFRDSLLPLSSFQTLRCLFPLSKLLQTFYILHISPFLDFPFPFHISSCSISPFHIYSCSWSSLWTCLLPLPVSPMNVPDHLLWQFPLRALSSPSKEILYLCPNISSTGLDFESKDNVCNFSLILICLIFLIVTHVVQGLYVLKIIRKPNSFFAWDLH